MLKMKIISIAAIAGMVLAFAPATQADILLQDNWTGDYRIIFNTTAYTSQNITQAQADNFVDGDANNALRTQTAPLGLTWTSVTSFIGGNEARTNTGTTGSGTGIHIYTPHDSGTFRLIATDYDDLWDGSIVTTILRGDGSEGPNDGSNNSPWTGTSGTGTPDLPLGDLNGNKRVGNIFETGSWVRGSEEDPTNLNSMYGISGVVSSPVPEPGTMSLLAIGGLGVLLMRRRRRS